MPTLEENVNRVKAAKTAIGNAITAKGGTVGANDGLEDFAADIATIPTGGGSNNAEFTNNFATFSMFDNIKSIEIPDGVTSIKQEAFRSARNLEYVKMPNSVVSIGASLFRACGQLKTVILSNQINTIPVHTFNDSGLRSIEIPSSVTDIKSEAFYYCAKLEFIKFTSITPPSIENNFTFYGIPTTCIIYVPTGTLSAYTSAANYPDPNTYTYVEY